MVLVQQSIISFLGPLYHACTPLHSPEGEKILDPTHVSATSRMISTLVYVLCYPRT